MAQSPSPLRHALLEPTHLVGLLLALVLLFYVGFSLPAVAVVAGLELFYLLVFANTPAYRRRVQLKSAGEAVEQRQLELANRAATLNRDDRRTWQSVEKLHQEVIGLLEKASGQGKLNSIDRNQLDQLKEAALEFCLARQSFRQQLAKTSPEQLGEELNRLSATPAADPEAREAQRQTREILEQRIQHLTRMQQQLATIDARLQVIEQSFRLFKEQLSTLQTPTQLPPVSVGEVMRDVEATQRTLQEMAALELRH